MNGLDTGQGGREEEVSMLVNSGKNTGEHWTRKVTSYGPKSLSVYN